MDKSTLKVQRNPELGRYYVAARNLKAGEVLFEEKPFAIGPKTSSPPLCLSCYCPVDGGEDGPKCSKCSWPLCKQCNEAGGNYWHNGECEIFVKANCKFQCVEDSTASCVQLDCITPLRWVCLYIHYKVFIKLFTWARCKGQVQWRRKCLFLKSVRITHSCVFFKQKIITNVFDAIYEKSRLVSILVWHENSDINYMIENRFHMPNLAPKPV
jgi:hypothetical protein